MDTVALVYPHQLFAAHPALAPGRPPRYANGRDQGGTDMPANKKLLILPGDGIGIEVMAEVRRVIDWMGKKRRVSFDIDEDKVGGAAILTGFPAAWSQRASW